MGKDAAGALKMRLGVTLSNEGMHLPYFCCEEVHGMSLHKMFCGSAESDSDSEGAGVLQEARQRGDRWPKVTHPLPCMGHFVPVMENCPAHDQYLRVL